MVQADITEKKHRFDIHIGNIRHEKLCGDVQRIQQVLLNMLSNAIKYTPPEGRVTLNVAEKPSAVPGRALFECRVTDTGIGMTPDFIRRLFQPFERADDATIRHIQGTGLGMAISQNIAHMMNGSISAHSEYGKGSTFTATLELKVLREDDGRAEALADLPVLVVDDDEISCRNACLNLKEIGMSGEWVLSGAEAVERAEAALRAGAGFFAVIVDLMMPGMDGIETSRELRRRLGPEVPIILISAYDWSEYEEAALKAGVDGFICKPLLKSGLMAMMKRFVSPTEEPPSVRKSNAVSRFPGKRILIVEDNEINREIACALLEETEATLETAENGRMAVDKIAAAPPGHYDLIFMDLQMPVMDGWEATRRIRAFEGKGAHLPIVAMSANAFPEDIERSKEAGMDDHVAKPIDLPNLFRVMEKTLRSGES